MREKLMKESSVLRQAREVVKMEAEAALSVAERLGEGFLKAIELILTCRGKVIVTGIGKAGAVARKVASTFSSTGTPALFLHPSEGVHGDLGIISAEDVVVVLSYSGETQEILGILAPIKRVGSKVISFTGRSDSFLGENSDVIIDINVGQEACPLGLAPTCSTTAMLAVGDALAVCLMSARSFTSEDFARFHPGGILGRRLLLQVRDIMHTGDENPTIEADRPVREALFIMTASPLRGVVNVVDENQKLLGLFTDGDLRRKLETDSDVLDRPMREVMTLNPTSIGPDRLATEALRIMKEREFDNLPVVDDEGRCLGIVDVQDLLKAGIV